eukprot:CAMPEP_0170554188 /NCGR_PEP_ID=MMETSP0211-20121228/12065_1 /TAXON_ID=311385 /ORGANISM="Pseudokeronopsis sp., Strain OXSARD2" /LENGTH=59 /DNA_ID=CAMNT_0010863087 /DNA_START=232 /DNA_END=411 /DNA_ORIENTATION=+
MGVGGEKSIWKNAKKENKQKINTDYNITPRSEASSEHINDLRIAQIGPKDGRSKAQSQI